MQKDNVCIWAPLQKHKLNLGAHLKRIQVCTLDEPLFTDGKRHLNEF